METKKIASACFVGGALCCAIALMFAPIYWWFGLAAGLAAGYISYEFRQVLKAIPIALRAAGRGSMHAWSSVIASAKAWLSQPHPLFYSGMILTLPLLIFFGGHMVSALIKDGSGMELGWWLTFGIMGFVAIILWYLFASSIFSLVSLGFMEIGSRAERCVWVSPTETPDLQERDWYADMRAKGYREVPLTYANAVRWMAKGFLLVANIFLAWALWKLWKYLAIGIWFVICFLCLFVWYMFKLIHSQERVLCAIDGTLGGAVSYLWLASAHMSFSEQVVLVIFGGLLGTAFGVLNWEIVSKRILRLAPISGASV